MAVSQTFPYDKHKMKMKQRRKLTSRRSKLDFVRPTGTWLTLAILLLALLRARPAFAQVDQLDASLHEQVLNVPGNPGHPVMLQITTFTPDGPGPFPLAILNHGKEYGRAKEQLRCRSTYIARYFLFRGYVVVLPIMRGIAGSGGVFNPHGCDVEADGLSQARDIAAVIGHMARQPNVDASRIIVSGQSFGGWNTLAFGTLGYPRVKGILNFSGGIRQQACPDWESNLVNAAGYYGVRTWIPSLWFYGGNDSLFAPTTWHAMYDHYVQSGGPATLIAYGTFMTDAHNMLGSLEGFPIWMPKVDAFLAGLGLPSKLIDDRYLPATIPPPSHFAAIDDVNAVPYQGDKGRQEYRVFLTKPFPRVFIVAPMGLGARFDVGYDPLTRGMEACRKIAPDAQLYVVDDQVVWTRPDASKVICGYEQAAVKGDAVSMFQLARAYETGLGVDKDNSKALSWLQKAASAGLAMAQNELGNYKSGQDVLTDYSLAFIWYEKAAGQGNAAAEANLGFYIRQDWSAPRLCKPALGIEKPPSKRKDPQKTIWAICS